VPPSRDVPDFVLHFPRIPQDPLPVATRVTNLGFPFSLPTWLRACSSFSRFAERREEARHMLVSMRGCIRLVLVCDGPKDSRGGSPSRAADTAVALASGATGSFGGDTVRRRRGRLIPGQIERLVDDASHLFQPRRVSRAQALEELGDHRAVGRGDPPLQFFDAAELGNARRLSVDGHSRVPFVEPMITHGRLPQMLDGSFRNSHWSPVPPRSSVSWDGPGTAVLSSPSFRG
jgi:hypothetical protein